MVCARKKLDTGCLDLLVIVLVFLMPTLKILSLFLLLFSLPKKHFLEKAKGKF